MVLDNDTRACVESYRALSQKVTELETMRGVLTERIKTAMGDEQQGTLADGSIAVRWTKTVRRTISPTLLRKRFGESELAEFYVETETRRFVVTEPS